VRVLFNGEREGEELVADGLIEAIEQDAQDVAQRCRFHVPRNAELLFFFFFKHVRRRKRRTHRQHLEHVHEALRHDILPQRCHERSVGRLSDVEPAS